MVIFNLKLQHPLDYRSVSGRKQSMNATFFQGVFYVWCSPLLNIVSIVFICQNQWGLFNKFTVIQNSTVFSFVYFSHSLKSFKLTFFILSLFSVSIKEQLNLISVAYVFCTLHLSSIDVTTKLHETRE